MNFFKWTDKDCYNYDDPESHTLFDAIMKAKDMPDPRTTDE